MTDYAKKIIHRKREKIKENKQKKEIVSIKIKINVKKNVKTVKKGQKRANLRWHKSLPLGVCRSPTPKIHPSSRSEKKGSALSQSDSPRAPCGASAFRRYGLAARARPTCLCSFGGDVLQPGCPGAPDAVCGCFSMGFGVLRQTATRADTGANPLACA